MQLVVLKPIKPKPTVVVAIKPRNGRIELNLGGEVHWRFRTD